MKTEIPLYAVTGLSRGGKSDPEPSLQPAEGRGAERLDTQGVRGCECLS